MKGLYGRALFAAFAADSTLSTVVRPEGHLDLAEAVVANGWVLRLAL